MALRQRAWRRGRHNGAMSLALLFLTVFAFNILPAFAPPTWMVLSFYGFRHPGSSAWLVALVAATSATGGRLVLALLAQRFATSRWARPQMRDNLEAVAEIIHRRRSASALLFLLFAFSPLPSNVLFMAYGMTGGPLWLLALPFFIGRVVSYSVAFAGGSFLAGRFDAGVSTASSLYFLASQLALLFMVWLFTRINWRQALSLRWLRWLS